MLLDEDILISDYITQKNIEIVHICGIRGDISVLWGKGISLKTVDGL